MTRRLAYRSTPGESHTEAAWVSARRWLQGESEDQAKAAIQQDVTAGKVIVVEEGK